MKPAQVSPTRRQSAAVVAVLLVFVAALMFIGMKGKRAGAFDLTSSYVGCRLFVMGQTDHLYPQDLAVFNKMSDPVWKEIAAGDATLSGMVVLPPYVQTPLWGYSLQPLCRAMAFQPFNRIFLLFAAFSFAGILWFTAKYWCIGLFNPLWMAILCAGFLTTEPLRYAMDLTQTHVIFLLMSLVAIIWAQNGRPVSAGILLSIAAAVKITPALLVIYWLATGRRKAALSFVCASAGLLLATIALTGEHTMAAYVHCVSRVSNVLLVSYNNQSFAAFWAGRSFPRAEIYDWHSFVLPPVLKAFSFFLVLLSALAGGFMDRKLLQAKKETPPYGAVITLLGATMFTPLAWSHYYILLIIPVMLLANETVRQRSWQMIVLIIAIVFPTIYYFVRAHAALVGMRLPDVIRTEFYAGVAAMVALGVLYQRGIRQDEQVSTRPWETS